MISSKVLSCISLGYVNSLCCFCCEQNSRGILGFGYVVLDDVLDTSFFLGALRRSVISLGVFYDQNNLS